MLQNILAASQGCLLALQGLQLGLELALLQRNQSRQGFFFIGCLTRIEAQQKLALRDRFAVAEQHLGHASAGRSLDLDGATDGFELALNGDHLIDPEEDAAQHSGGAQPNQGWPPSSGPKPGSGVGPANDCGPSSGWRHHQPSA